MLIVKGRRVTLKMLSGRSIHVPAFCHDEAGKQWPRTTCVLLPFKKLGTPLDDMKYFGPDYIPHEGVIEIPGDTRAVLSLKNWQPVGKVAEIRYDRKGEHQAAYYHPFKEGREPMLYRKGRAYRLELGRGARINSRGFIFP